KTNSASARRTRPPSAPAPWSTASSRSTPPRETPPAPYLYSPHQSSAASANSPHLSNPIHPLTIRNRFVGAGLARPLGVFRFFSALPQRPLRYPSSSSSSSSFSFSLSLPH